MRTAAGPAKLAAMSTPSALEAIAGRRSTRRFDPDRPLPDGLLKRILRFGTLAPSGFNLQPWRFLVVRSARNRRRLRACADGRAELTEAPVVLIVLAYHHPYRTDLDAVIARGLELGAITPAEAAEARGRAPRAIESRPDAATWALRPAMLAAATLMLAAEALGVASAAVEGFDEGRIRREFGVPDDHSVGLLIPLGFAAESPPFPGRLPLGRVCFEEHFGQPWTLGEAEEAGGDSTPEH